MQLKSAVFILASGVGQAPEAMKGGVPGALKLQGQLAHESQLIEPPCELVNRNYNIHAKVVIRIKYSNILKLNSFLRKSDCLELKTSIMSMSNL